MIKDFCRCSSTFSGGLEWTAPGLSWALMGSPGVSWALQGSLGGPRPSKTNMFKEKCQNAGRVPTKTQKNNSGGLLEDPSPAKPIFSKKKRENAGRFQKNKKKQFWRTLRPLVSFLMLSMTKKCETTPKVDHVGGGRPYIYI